MASHISKSKTPLQLEQERIERLELERVRLNRITGEVQYELDKAYDIVRHLSERKS